MPWKAQIAALESRLMAVIATVARDVDLAHWPTPGEGYSPSEPRHDFDPRWDADGKLYRTSGDRCIEGGSWESVAESDGIADAGNGTYWMRWTNTTDTGGGEWDEGFDPEAPSQDQTCTVVKLWTITEVDGVNQIQYHHRGSVRVTDWGDC